MSRLELCDTFEWNDHAQNSASENSVKRLPSSSDEEDECENSSKTKKSKTKKTIDEKEIEEHLFKIGSFDPCSPIFQELETLDECERLVLAYPNASKAWLLYMVFHLKQAEVEKARNIAEKALKTISFREEKEKFNIWVALLNLENLYGTQESLMHTFKQALSFNDPKSIYTHLVDLYTKSEKIEEAEELFSIMVQKFKQDKEVWMKFITFCMKLGKPEQARKLMDRSFKSLDKKYHADVMGKVAHLECEYGSFERGQSMFEIIIQNYPKRRDLLSIYISVLKKSGDQAKVEHLSTIMNKA